VLRMTADPTASATKLLACCGLTRHWLAGCLARSPTINNSRGQATDVAAACLGAGAAIDCQDRFGSTPLHFACRYGHRETARLLLQRAADTGICDELGRLPGTTGGQPMFLNR
jgi:ankyrin repeat protein